VLLIPFLYEDALNREGGEGGVAPFVGFYPPPFS
jgi:hypothetical protein